MSAAAKTNAKSNGNAPTATGNNPDALTLAIAYEEQIADEAAEIRGESTELTPTLYLKLYRLLRMPIPPGFIVSTGVVTGKPYESTGIKSLQVQIDRLDNVLTPLGWGWTVTYEQDGQLAHARAWIGPDPELPFVVREARGGVNRGSTIGNLYKGSETNAAKLAFARLGVGHEIYLGAVDFDPDVDEAAAAEQAKVEPAAKVERIDADRAAHLRDLFDKREDIDTKKLQVKLGSLGVTSVRTVNTGLATLTPGQAAELEEWLGGAQ
jgi:hypothetical protein